MLNPQIERLKQPFKTRK